MTGYFFWIVVIPLVVFLGGGALMSVIGAIMIGREIDRDPTV